MSTESIIGLLLAIIGCLIVGFVGYYIGNVDKQFTKIGGQIDLLTTTLQQHLKDCKFQDKREG